MNKGTAPALGGGVPVTSTQPLAAKGKMGLVFPSLLIFSNKAQNSDFLKTATSPNVNAGNAVKFE